MDFEQQILQAAKDERLSCLQTKAPEQRTASPMRELIKSLRNCSKAWKIEREYQRDQFKKNILRMKEINQNENFLREKSGKQIAITVGHIFTEVGSGRSCE